MCVCVRVCACVCACVRVCVRVCIRARARLDAGSRRCRAQGLLRDANGVYDAYESASYARAELDTYRDVFGRIRAALQEAYGLSSLYFTAPTFITRIEGVDGWEPREVHDEYYHPHVSVCVCMQACLCVRAALWPRIQRCCTRDLFGLCASDFAWVVVYSRAGTVRVREIS
jgi:hypothetical protein